MQLWGNYTDQGDQVYSVLKCEQAFPKVWNLESTTQICVDMYYGHV